MIFKVRLIPNSFCYHGYVELYQNLSGSFMASKTLLSQTFLVLMVEKTLFTLEYLALGYIFRFKKFYVEHLILYYTVTDGEYRSK